MSREGILKIQGDGFTSATNVKNVVRSINCLDRVKARDSWQS